MKGTGPNPAGYGDFWMGRTGITTEQWRDPECEATLIHPIWYDNQRSSNDENGGGYELVVLTTKKIVVGVIVFPRICRLSVRGFLLDGSNKVEADGHYVQQQGSTQKEREANNLEEKFKNAVDFAKAVVADV